MISEKGKSTSTDESDFAWILNVNVITAKSWGRKFYYNL